MPRLRNAATCQRAIDRAMEWLKAYCGGDEWTTQAQPLLTYHKVPYLFAVRGQPEECRRALAWIKTNLLTPEGDLLAAPRAEGKPPALAHIREKTWIALAAHISGRYDLSFPAARFFAAQQGRSTGGVYNLGKNGVRDNITSVRTTACAGLAFLACGMHTESRLAARFCLRVLQNQPEPNRFFFRMDQQGRLVRKFPRAGAPPHVVAVADKRPAVSYLAMPCIFLARMHLATGEAEWIEAAMDYYGFAEQCTGAAESEDSASLAWAGALLYGISRRRSYYDSAERLAQTWIDRQRPDGSWRARGAVKDTAAAVALTAATAIFLQEALREAQ